MNNLKQAFLEDINARLLKIENEFEEFSVNISENNLKLKTPYVKDINSQDIGISVLDNSLTVYIKGKAIGHITINT